MRVDFLHRGKPGGKQALSVRDGGLTYGELEAAVAAAANAIAAMGVTPGERVAVWANKTPRAIVALLGACRAGAIAIPVNPQLKSAQVSHILADSGARLLVANAARLRQLGDAGIATITLDEDWPPPAQSSPEPPERKADDLAMILYTSGSTGKPKGVMLSHANLCLGAESVAAYLETDGDDRILAVLPLSFDYGLNQVLTALRQGAEAVLLDFLIPRDVARAVARHRITQLAGVPPLWMQLNEIDWKGAGESLRVLTNTGGHMPERLTRAYAARFPQARIFLMYGLTEAFRSAYLDPALALEKPASIGKAVPHAELFVVRDDGSEAAPGEVGELVHCGPLVAQGYWQDETRTRERFRPAPAYSKYGGTAVWSGDRMKRDAEGFLYFVGRADDMIKTSGNRVSPAEIEEAAQATGFISEAAAFGIADERLDQAICLFAVPVDDCGEDDIRRAMMRDLPRFMVPRDIVLRSALPRSPNGKIDRGALKNEIAPHG